MATKKKKVVRKMPTVKTGPLGADVAQANVGEIGSQIGTAKTGPLGGALGSTESIKPSPVPSAMTPPASAVPSAMKPPTTPVPSADNVADQLAIMEQRQSQIDASIGQNIFDPSIGYGKAGMEKGKFTETGTAAVERIKASRKKKVQRKGK